MHATGQRLETALAQNKRIELLKLYWVKSSGCLKNPREPFSNDRKIQWCKHPKFCLLDPVESKGLLPGSLVIVCVAQVLGKYMGISYEVPGMPFQDIVK